MGEFVHVEVEDLVATIRLDRPPMNAINEDVTRELQEAALEASGRDDVGAVVVWGGEKIFAAGADVKMMLPMTPREVKPMITTLQEVFNVVEEIPKVTIAAINGYALGGGCELAMCADLRYAAEDARIGQPEIQLGIIPGAGGTQRLPRLVGPARAKDLIYSGRHVKAEEARQIGLVDEVFPADQVYLKAVEAARRYARGRSRHSARRRRPSTGEGGATSAPGSSWSASCSPISFPPRTRRRACAPSWSKGPARRSSRGSDRGPIQRCTHDPARH